MNLLFAAALTAVSFVTDGPRPIQDLEKVPEVARKEVMAYANEKVSGKATVIDVEHMQTDNLDGGKNTDTHVLLAEEAGSSGGCRYREHKISREAYDKGGEGNAMGSAGEYASDCCALVNDFPCDRTGVDWMLHYDRARRTGNGKALAKLAFKAFYWKLNTVDDGKPVSATMKYTVADLEKNKKVDRLPAVDPLRMAISCEQPDEKGYFICRASQGGNHLTFEWRHVSDKTKTRFETKLIRIESYED